MSIGKCDSKILGMNGDLSKSTGFFQTTLFIDGYWDVKIEGFFGVVFPSSCWGLRTEYVLWDKFVHMGYMNKMWSIVLQRQLTKPTFKQLRVRDVKQK